MSYTHLTKTELVFIEEYHKFGLSGRKIAKKLECGHESIFRVIRQLKQGLKVIDIYRQYKKNKSKCGRKRIILPPDQKEYINIKVQEGWTPDDIICRKEKPISCRMRTLYRRFSEGEFNQNSLPMQGKRKPNVYQEKRGRQSFRRTIKDREKDYPNYDKEFGHLEGDTIIGKHHKSAVITFVERVSKCIIAIKPADRQAAHIETSLNKWLNQLPRNLFKSIIFDCGKNFSSWKSISNEQDIDIYFVDPGTPSQRGLNEHSNGLLRRNGLPKEMDFNLVSQDYILKVAKRRNNIPRKSLGYLTPIEYFIKHIDPKYDKDILSRLI